MVYYILKENCDLFESALTLSNFKTPHMNFLNIQFHRLLFPLVLGKSFGGKYKSSGNLI